MSASDLAPLSSGQHSIGFNPVARINLAIPSFLPKQRRRARLVKRQRLYFHFRRRSVVIFPAVRRGTLVVENGDLVGRGAPRRTLGTLGVGFALFEGTKRLKERGETRAGSSEPTIRTGLSGILGTGGREG